VKKLFSDKKIIVVINKTDIASKKDTEAFLEEFKNQKTVLEGHGMNTLKELLLSKQKN
jgi:ribosome biogenesis GTPase A